MRLLLFGVFSFRHSGRLPHIKGGVWGFLERDGFEVMIGGVEDKGDVVISFYP